MNSLCRAFLAVATVLALSGCVNERLSWRLAPPTPMGTSVTAGVVESFAVNEPAPGQKQGRAESQSFLNLVSTGNAGAAQAAKAGGINRIEAADVEVIRVRALGLPIFTRYTVIVRGE